jgi:PleD family two-component response regulator
MNEAQILAVIRIAQLVTEAFGQGVTRIRGIIRAIRPETTDEELNLLVLAVQDDARRRRALAEADLAALELEGAQGAQEAAQAAQQGEAQG